MPYRTIALTLIIVIISMSLFIFLYFILIQNTESDGNIGSSCWWLITLIIENKIGNHTTEITTNLSTIEMSSMEQNDPRLISEIRRRFLIPPRDTPYFLKNTSLEDPSVGSKKFLNLLQNMTGDFFIECGASDGEFMSNTLYLERKLGWTGLLIEADPKFLENIYKMQRHAWVAPVCLSTKTSPMFVPLHPEKIVWRGHVLSVEETIDPSVPSIQCLPIYSLLLALNRTTVDYFSLNVDGEELEILRTIPFHLVDIRVFTIEYNSAIKYDLQQFMVKNGYELYLDYNGTNIGAHDFIFVKKST